MNKQDFPPQSANERIQKIVSSMANTHGGWVLFGVEEIRDAQGRGLPGQLLGLDASNMPAKRLIDVSLAIYPPVLPEIGICPVPNVAGKAIVVARIFESDSTPHRTSSGKVYVRAGDICSLQQDGKEASIEELEMLLNRREKSLALKTRLLERASERTAFGPKSPQLAVYCVPKYPSVPLTDLGALSDIAGSAVNWTAYKGADVQQTAHESIMQCSPKTGPGLVAAEFNIYGLSFYNTIITANDPSGRVCFDAGDCLNCIWSVVQASELFYRITEYGGLVDVAMHLKLENRLSARLRVGREYFESPADRTFTVTHTTHAHRLLEERRVVISLFEEFLWSAGFGTDSLIENWEKYVKSAEDRHKNIKVQLPKRTRQVRS